MTNQFTFFASLGGVTKPQQQKAQQASGDRPVQSTQPVQQAPVEKVENPIDKAEQLLKENEISNDSTSSNEIGTNISEEVVTGEEFIFPGDDVKIENNENVQETKIEKEIAESSDENSTDENTTQTSDTEFNFNSDEIAETQDDKASIDTLNDNEDEGEENSEEDVNEKDSSENNSTIDYRQQSLLGFDDVTEKDNKGKTGVKKGTTNAKVEPPAEPIDPAELAKVKIVFVHGSVKEEIKQEFLTKTLDDYRKEVAKEIPSFEDKSKVTWRVEYAGAFKNVEAAITIQAAKELAEKEKTFNASYHKAKDRACYIKATVQGQTKGTFIKIVDKVIY